MPDVKTNRTRIPNHKLSSEFKMLQKQKPGVEKRTIENLLYYHSRQYDFITGSRIGTLADDDNHVRLVLNMARKRTDQLIGRLSAADPVFGAKPNTKDPKHMANAEVVDQLIMALSEKLDDASLDWDRLFWLAIGGVCFEYTRWVPDKVREPMKQFGPGFELMFVDQETREVVPRSVARQIVQQGAPPERFRVHEKLQTTGDLGTEILGPLNVFMPNSVRSIDELAPDQSVMIAKLRTKGWVEQNYPNADLEKLEPAKDVRIVRTDLSMEDPLRGLTSMNDLIPTVQGKVRKNDPDMFVVVERFTQPSPDFPRGRYSAFIPEQEKGTLVDDHMPYEQGLTIRDYHYTKAATPWNPGFMETLLSVQDFVNKRVSQGAEVANANVHAPWLLSPGLDPEDVPRDMAGFVKDGLSEDGNPRVAQMPVNGPGGWFSRLVEEGFQVFDLLSGPDILSTDKFPGQLRGPLAVPLLQEIKDSEFKPLMQHIARQKAAAIQDRINLVKQFYPSERVMHYVSRDLKEETLVFKTDDILRSGVEYRVSVEPDTIMPELKAINEARIIERFQSGIGPILYADERTGQIDKTKVAADLKFGDTGRVDAESAARKMQQQEIEVLWRGKSVPVIPMQDHNAHMDEMVAVMETMEFLKASEQVQKAFLSHMKEHMDNLERQASAAQEAAQGEAVQATMNQVAQQTAAQTVSRVVDEALPQMLEQLVGRLQNTQGNGEFAGPSLQREPREPTRPPAPEGV